MAQQLVAPTKWRARGAPKVGSQAYWKEKIEGASGTRYTEYWTHINYYELERIQASTQLKYFANLTGGRGYTPFAGKTSGSGLGSVQ